MRNNIARILLAAPQSGSGKTVITCALLQALLDEGVHPSAFKCGPDYIDPMFHRMVLGVPSKNLDSFFADAAWIRQSLLDGAGTCDFAVMEGAMGLFDGLAGIKEEASAYHIATLTDTPIILVVNARGMGGSIIPLLAGFLQYDHAHLIRGVILNQTTPMFCKWIAPQIEEELKIAVLGCLPVQENLSLQSRHLGLWMPEEIVGLREQIRSAADVLKKTIDLERLIQIGRAAEEVTASAFNTVSVGKKKAVRIGVARDEAFCFYYEDNLRMLEQAGAELVFFSPIHDKKLPREIGGLVFGGGYPELYAAALEENVGMRGQINKAIAQGMPSVAECGGFMYLHEKMQDMDGRFRSMVGAIAGSIYNRKKLVRFGYCTIQLQGETQAFLKKGEKIQAHEFHYFDSDNNGTDCCAVKPVTQRMWKCVHANQNHWWGFPHLYYPSNPQFAVRFVEKAEHAKRNC